MASPHLGFAWGTPTYVSQRRAITSCAVTARLLRKHTPMKSTRSTLKMLLAIVTATFGIVLTTTMGATSSASADPKSISGSLDDWEQAVCATGSVVTGGRKMFPNSVGGDHCRSKASGRPILIGEWNDNYLMQNDITIFRGGSYVSAKNGQSVIDLVSPVPGDSGLQPLTQFGFVVNPIPARGQ